MDYSRWDALAAEEEREEQKQKQEQRVKNKQDYLKQQEERVKQHQQQQQQQQQSPPQPSSSSSSPSPAPHSHSHPDGPQQPDDGHDHEHHHHEHAPNSASSSASSERVDPYRRSCGCGMTDVATLMKMKEEAERNPGPSVAEKNRKKVLAVQAVREHGKLLFDEGKFQEALAVYERGALIISGMYDLEPAVQEEMSEQEVVLTLNMALCSLRLHQYTAAADQARTALQLIDPSTASTSSSSLATKAHFRIAQAMARKGDWEEAKKELAIVRGSDASWPGLKEEEARIRKGQQEERRKEADFSAKMREKLRLQQERDRQQQQDSEYVDKLSGGDDEVKEAASSC